MSRTSLIVQVANVIRSHLQSGAWGEWLPGQRELSTTLAIGRSTCRKSVLILQSEKLLEVVPGRGVRISRTVVTGSQPLAGRQRSVGILLPRPGDQLSPWMALMICEIRLALSVSGARLDAHVNPRCFGRDPTRSLESLARQTRHDCWILVHSTEAVQRWFDRRQLPSVVCGCVFPGVGLSSVSLDYRAICRHAVGRLISLGHQRLAFLNSKFPGAAELESERGFAEGAGFSPKHPVDLRILRYDDTPASVGRLATSREVTDMLRPTGWLVAGSYAWSWALGALLESGLRVRRDFSIICRDDDVFLRYSYPEAARYASEPDAFARKLVTAIRKLLAGNDADRQAIRIIPCFVPGASCGPPPCSPEFTKGSFLPPDYPLRTTASGFWEETPAECLAAIASR